MWLQSVNPVEAEDLVLLHGQVYRADASQRLGDARDSERGLPIQRDVVIAGGKRDLRASGSSGDPVKAVGGNRALGKRKEAAIG